jgi:phosphate transport system protein
MEKYQGRKSLDLDLLEVESKVNALSSQVQAVVKNTMESFYSKELEKSKKIIDDDININNFSREIETITIEIIRRQSPLASDMRKLTSIIFVCQELERIADYASGICKIGLKIGNEPFITQFEKIPKMEEKALEMLKKSLNLFCNIPEIEKGLSVVKELMAQDDEMDYLNSQVQRDLIKRMSKDANLVKQGTFLIWISHNLERIADRSTDIAERTLYVISGDSNAVINYDLDA